ncbi:hypothetical protein [Pseudomonas sp. G5(2012)]|uniref:hypothetical protein n=1 Tax=Pseudomonas sp. G5(2012) TaxID=1268068 RepID=UPI0003431361|nr:hypothetical protein [Pseudomonas sp. G5(2012)]EPA98558.1 hypothetical protein PG5_09140 [Pseudomonas sp. G5(2012)]
MALPIAGNFGRVITLPGPLTEPSTAASRSSDLMLNPSRLEGSSAFHLAMLGTPRQVAVAMESMDRRVAFQVEESYRQLGETDRTVVGRVSDFIDHGGLPEELVNEDFFARATELNRADNEQTRESRMRTVLEAGLELLGKAGEPARNLLNITARTGLVVALTTVLRQIVGYYVEKAIREGDSPEASRAWEVAAITMIGPAMSLMGAIRDECAGTASLQSRLGRVCMASITMGALIAAHVTGASNTILSSIINTNIYTVARDLSNAFFPLQDNAGAASAGATGVTTVAYGTLQYLLAELGALMPLSGPGRYAADLGYSLCADIFQGAMNALGAVFDDFIFILCRSWPLLSPSAGLDSVLSDPESLQQSVLQVRAGARLPSREQLTDTLLNVNASRTSAFQALNLAVSAAAVELALTDMGEETQGHVVNVCVMLMLMLIYFPFIWSCSQRTDNQWSPEQLRENPAP